MKIICGARGGQYATRSWSLAHKVRIVQALTPDPSPKGRGEGLHAGVSDSSSLARRLRATCRRRLMVPTGVPNFLDISMIDRPSK